MADQRGYTDEDGEDLTAEDLLAATEGRTPEPPGGPRGVYTEALPKRKSKGP